MKIRYKLILIFVFIIIAAALPLSLFNLFQQEKQLIRQLDHRGRVNSSMIARFGLSVLMMNGGDLENSRVDLRDMMGMLDLLSEEGVVYADVIMLSGAAGMNGERIAHYRNGNILRADPFPAGRDGSAARRALAGAGPSIVRLPGIPGQCTEFLAAASLPGRHPLCAGRIVYSRSTALVPIIRLRRVIFVSTAVAVGVVTVLGLAFSGFLTRPIRRLIEGVGRLGAGDLSHRVSVQTKDEFRILANTFNDLSQMIKLEIDQLIAANLELKRLDALKDEFIANMSHELRSPLYGMIGLAESLAGGVWGAQSPESVHNLQMIALSGKRLAGLVDDLLDFSRLKYGDIVLRRGPVNVHSVAQYAASIMSPLAARKGLVIVNAIPPGGWWADGDEDRLQQVLLNLVGNAVKFTEKGSVTIEAERDAATGSVRITVSDTGIGVPEGSRENIFRPFEQADGSVSRSYGGTGIGLAISRHLVELHGGRIWTEPRDDGGSRFILTLPSCGPGTAAAPGPALPMFREERAAFHPGSGELVKPSVAGPPQGKWRVLVVDDERVNLQVMVNELSMDGYEVIVAESGVEALEIIAGGRVDLVVLDVMLPRMSGFEVCRRIRETRPSHDLPVLMLTARNRTEDVVAGLESGANDYVAKPVGRLEFLARVRGLLSLERSFRLHEELALIKREVQIAHNIQSVILAGLPALPDGMRVAFRYCPMTELGGDFYDIRKLSERSLAVLVADVSGHGIPAALICSMLKIAYELNYQAGSSPAVIMETLNRIMSGYLDGQFITACFAVIDRDAMTIRYANAGHWPIILQTEGDDLALLDSGPGFIPLGWDRDARYETSEIPIGGAARIVFYTDGIVEARDGGDHMFGEERFHDLLKARRGDGPDELAEAVVGGVDAWEGGSRRDDVTFVVVDVSR